MHSYYGKVSLPKAELHVHLEGSIGPETLLAIDPSLDARGDRRQLDLRIVRGIPARLHMDYQANCEKPEHYALATRHLLESLAAQNVTYAEITLSAGVVLWKQQDLAAVYDAVWKESQRSKFRRSGFWMPSGISARNTGMEVARFAVSRRDDGVIAYRDRRR